jgi:hypothetical protein
MPNPGGEAAHQQHSAVTALGFEYVAAPYETRRADLEPEAVDYRFVGALDGTTLSYDPPIPGAPATLAQGEVVDIASSAWERSPVGSRSGPMGSTKSRRLT